MRQLTLGIFLVWSLCFDYVLSAAEPPRTAAETSEYQVTSSYAEVVAFCEELTKQSDRVRQLTLGKSQEGRNLPLLIIADPPVATAAEAAKSNKLVVLAIANIHAGEVDGKEALLMLARDLALAQEHSLLNHLVIAFVPIFNADGNERLASHRPEQFGPREVGTRENALGLDLNRDFLKLETPEVRSLVQFLNTWNPAIVIDCHTTNGSHHRYTLTYEGGRCPAGEERLIEFTRDKLLPLAGRKLAERTGFQSYFYGNFAADHTRWETILPLPRYGTHYVGLRNRVAVLSESYSYAPFKDRVLATQEFVQGLLQVASENHDELRKLMPEMAVASADRPRVALRYKAAPLGPKAKVLGYVAAQRDGNAAQRDGKVAQQGGKSVATNQPRDYEAQYFGGTDTTLSVAPPAAYLLPARLVKVVENLQRHGLTAEQLSADSVLDVEVYRVDELNRGRSFQRHELVGLEVTPRKEKRRIETGTILIRTAQPLGSLAVHLLEPQSADGLATWNFFDEWLTAGSDYPVLRLPSATMIHSAPVPPPPEDSR